MSRGSIRYAIEVDIKDRVALVVGLGQVGRRKALGLLEAGALVRGVDPHGWDEAPSGVDVILEPYRTEHLRGAFLVFAAAHTSVNSVVTVDALAANLLVSSASEPESGTFSRPAVWRDGNLVLTVSTSGASPALAKALRDRAVESLGASAAPLTDLFARLRPRLFELLPDPKARRKIMANWGHSDWLSLLESGGVEAVIREFDRRVSDELV